MDNIYLRDTINAFQTGYIDALNDAYSHIVMPTTGINNIVITSVMDVQTRMVPINSDKTIYFASCGFIVVFDKYLRKNVVQIEPTDYDIDEFVGLVFNDNIYRKLPCLEYVLPKRTSAVDLINTCFTDIANIIQISHMEEILHTGQILTDYATEYVTDILTNPSNTKEDIDLLVLEYAYNSAYNEYAEYFSWFDPYDIYKKMEVSGGYRWC